MSRQNENALLSLHVIVNPEEHDEDYRDELARQLVRECEDVDGVMEAKLASGGEAPEGARAGELVSIGQIIIEVLPDVLVALIGAIQAWMLRDARRTTRIKVGDTELEIPAKMSPEEVQELAERLLDESKNKD
jgi:hypothetical protein